MTVVCEVLRFEDLLKFVGEHEDLHATVIVTLCVCDLQSLEPIEFEEKSYKKGWLVRVIEVSEICASSGDMVSFRVELRNPETRSFITVSGDQIQKQVDVSYPVYLVDFRRQVDPLLIQLN